MVFIIQLTDSALDPGVAHELVCVMIVPNNSWKSGTRWPSSGLEEAVVMTKAQARDLFNASLANHGELTRRPSCWSRIFD